MLVECSCACVGLPRVGECCVCVLSVRCVRVGWCLRGGGVCMCACECVCACVVCGVASVVRVFV